jgi:1-acyl-sn-glycerol-3-phosphate acyltransferase
VAGPPAEPSSDPGEPAATEPAATEPAATEPAATEPAATEPAAGAAPDDPAAVDPAASDPAAAVPADEPAATDLAPAAAPEELRRYLPGLEPDRHLDDWGRSERVEALIDRTVYEFLYHYWFRVEVEGIENVPAEGGALLVANHAGAVPPDAAMIVKAIREEHPRPRPVTFLTNQALAAVPGLGMLVTKLGGVPDHPANLHRLLFDEGQLVLVFPEGAQAPAKPLKERYRLRPFDHGDPVAAAIRAQVPIVPVAVVGAEEAMPVLGRLSLLRRVTRLPQLKLAPLLPLPAKFSIRFLEPVHAGAADPGDPRDGARAQTMADDIRALIQENLLEMVASRRSPWLG